MSRRIITGLILAILADASSSHAVAGTWSDLWSTHEQQGQQLLDSNHPGQAAALFSDPKRRAYAQLQAGQYDKAAQLLAPLKDADSQYNRGNALAHTGKLRDALTAYDAALASSPGNKDVLRNRELVERALQAQNRQRNGNSSSGQNGKGQQGQSNSGGQGSNGAGEKQAGQQGQQPDSGSQAQSGGQSQAAQNQQGQQPKDGSQAQSGSQNQATAQNQPAQQPNSASQAQAGSEAQSAQPAQAANAAQPAHPGQRDPNDATQLQPAQMSGTGTQRADGRMADSPIVKGSAAADAYQSQPRSEQALALDQWLRGIPEDSSELLRRKFLIEHMMKQQGYQP
jgi:Ca-activated chloride channel family protein